MIFTIFRTRVTNVEALHKHAGFVLLCNKLTELAPTIRNPQSLINCLSALVHCELDGESPVVVKLLNLIKSKESELNAKQVTNLRFLARKLGVPSFFEVPPADKLLVTIKETVNIAELLEIVTAEETELQTYHLSSIFYHLNLLLKDQRYSTAYKKKTKYYFSGLK